MKVHYLQHVPFEGLGSIEPSLIRMGCRISSTQLYKVHQLPEVDTFDWLIVMGGPMGIYDEQQHPWLTQEKALIEQAIQQNKKVLGICLGAQLIADVLGAKVAYSGHREIGWFDIQRMPDTTQSILADHFPEQAEVFHWHGDTFEIPAGALHIAASNACRNQGFIYDDRVIALQFHLETTQESAAALIEHCSDELDGTSYVQSADEMMADPSRFHRINGIMQSVLDALAAT